MIDEVEKIRAKSAKFYKVDLHHHSPLSHDWRNDETPANSPRNPLLDRISSIDSITDEVLDAYYEELKKSNLDMVAITDHMKYSFGIALSDFVSRKGGNISILPGIELNIKINQPLINDCKIHIIAIFPPNTKDKIDRIMPPNIPPEKDRSGKEEISLNNLSEIIDEVHELQGKVIAAHIYSNNGLRAEYIKSAKLILKPISETEERKQLYQNVGDAVKFELYKTDCLQVSETTDPIHFKDNHNKLMIPLIIATDAHHVKDFAKSIKLTFIKMGELTFQSLHEAFKYPDTRIRFEKNFPEIKPPRIRGVRIIGQSGNEKAFFKNLIVGFSDNLTCLVGPRGSGKSALIDAIRYAMGYNRILDQVRKVKDQVIERQQHTLQASRIEILYEKSDGNLHRIESTYDSKELYNTRIFNLDENELNIDDIEASGEYPLNLYGWNELELIGEDHSTQREMIDRFIDDLKSLKSEKNILYQKLSENTHKCLTALQRLDNYFVPSKQSTSFLRLREFEDEFNRLNTDEIAKVFERLDNIEKKVSFLKELQTEINEGKEKFETIPSIAYDTVLAKHEGIEEWGRSFIYDRLKANEINDDFIQKKSELKGKVNAQIEIVVKELSKIEVEKNGASKEIRAIIGEDEKAISADLRNTAKKRRDTANAEFEQYKKDLGILEELLNDRSELIRLIKEINQIIFATRNAKIADIKEKIQIVNDENYRIDLKLEQAKDRDNFRNSLYDIGKDFFEGQWRNKKVPDLLADKLNPFEFTEAFINRDAGRLVNLITIKNNDIEKEYRIENEYAEKLIHKNSPYEEISELSVKRYYTEKFKQLFNLQQIEFDDVFHIMLNQKPIQHCSPGQRCSAMLPLVTLTSDAPIIIDQPEDNLDNRLVSKAVFKILSKLKETRQIIVATHNPNILVSGDAEQVFVLNDNGKVDSFGSIDDPLIIKSVVELMEGGKEAFEKRKNKYKDFI